MPGERAGLRLTVSGVQTPPMPGMLPPMPGMLPPILGMPGSAPGNVPGGEPGGAPGIVPGDIPGIAYGPPAHTPLPGWAMHLRSFGDTGAPGLVGVTPGMLRQAELAGSVTQLAGLSG